MKRLREEELKRLQAQENHEIGINCDKRNKRGATTLDMKSRGEGREVRILR